MSLDRRPRPAKTVAAGLDAALPERTFAVAKAEGADWRLGLSPHGACP